MFLLFTCLQAELARVREQLRQAEEQLQASRQQASLLASELRDSASARDHTMTELYRARLEADKLRASLADAQAECQRMESQLDRMRSAAQKEVVGVQTLTSLTVSDFGELLLSQFLFTSFSIWCLTSSLCIYQFMHVVTLPLRSRVWGPAGR